MGRPSSHADRMDGNRPLANEGRPQRPWAPTQGALNNILQQPIEPPPPRVNVTNIQDCNDSDFSDLVTFLGTNANDEPDPTSIEEMSASANAQEWEVGLLRELAKLNGYMGHGTSSHPKLRQGAKIFKPRVVFKTPPHRETPSEW